MTPSQPLKVYDARALSRRKWITEFIGHALRRGLADDPERAFDVASESDSEWGGWTLRSQPARLSFQT